MRGRPMVPVVSVPAARTRSKFSVSPTFAESRKSTSRRSPAWTRYWWLPSSKIANMGGLSRFSNKNSGNGILRPGDISLTSRNARTAGSRKGREARATGPARRRHREQDERAPYPSGSPAGFRVLRGGKFGLASRGVETADLQVFGADVAPCADMDRDVALLFETDQVLPFAVIEIRPDPVV